MSKSTLLDVVTYKAQQCNSLFTVISEQASNECSKELLDLISIACDLNEEIWQSAREATK